LTNAVGGVGIAPVIAAAERNGCSEVLGMGSLTLPKIAYVSVSKG